MNAKKNPEWLAGFNAGAEATAMQIGKQTQKEVDDINRYAAPEFQFSNLCLKLEDIIQPAEFHSED